jgi:DNA-binding SARP family transcriptional activator
VPDPTSLPRLLLLGGVDLTGTPDTAAAEQLLVQPKGIGLLAYLALAARPGRPARFQRRDRLAALLWPELDQPRARAALRKAVQTVRGALGAEAIAARGDEELALAEGALWCDAVAFARYLEQGLLAAALDLYEGELMPAFHLPGCGDFARWLDGERAGLRERAAGASWALAVSYEQSADHTAAVQWARRTVRYAWDDERALRRALVLLDHMGDRAGALRLYDEFARRLRADYESEPSRETLAVVAAMRAG